MSVIGRKVGAFEIVGKAEVPDPGAWYVGRRGSGETALVRLVPPDAPPTERAAVLRQVEVLRALEDPRVPAVLGWYEGLGAVAIQDARGTPLVEAVYGRAADLVLSPATLLDLLVPLAETLQRSHHRHRVHGHLDGTNVVLARTGALWVLGWGTDRPPASGWCPPEIARGEPATAATDQWSLAALGAALVSGRVPWAETDAPGSGLPGGILAPVERQWGALGRVLRRMLDAEPRARFPTMQVVRQELLALARQVREPSGRRALGAALDKALPEPTTEVTESPEVAPAPPPPPDPADRDLLVSEPERSTTLEEGPAARRGGWPEETIHVVRPEFVGEDLPETSTLQALLDRPDVDSVPTDDVAAPIPPAETTPPTEPPPNVFGTWSDEDEAWGAAPTAVPTTDSGEGDDEDDAPPTTEPHPSTPLQQWFDPSPDQASTAPPEPVPPRDDDPLPERPATRPIPAGGVSPRIVAAVLAAVLAVLLAVWLATRLT